MQNSTPQLTFVRDLFDNFETRHHHSHAARIRTERRVARGVYMDAAAWRQLDDDQQYAARVRAVALTRRNRPVISHWSAAVLHGLPVIGNWPRDVHVTHSGAGGRTRAGVVKHSLKLLDGDVVEADGLLLTSVARTIIDMASVADRMTAVAMADRALLHDRFERQAPLLSKQELREHWEAHCPFRGHVRSLDVIEFAESGAETPIESVSRVTMAEIGCPRPRLQVPHHDDDGYIGDPDFTWDEFGVVGEADGVRKYLDAAFRSGRTVEQVVLDEKRREDRLRAIDRTVRRWDWRVANDPVALGGLLRSAGLPTGIRRRKRRV